MISDSYLPKGTLFFPQIKSPVDSPSPVATAFQAFCKLIFNLETNLIVPNPLCSTGTNLFNLSALLRVLSTEEIPKPILVIGTFSHKDAVRHSWDELGLNLFNLPWSWSSSEEKKVFRYISLLSLPLYLKDLRNLFESDGNQNISLACQQAHEQLRWAGCHKLNADLKDSLGHGQRDWLQVAYRDEVSNRLRGIIESYQAEDFPCKGRCGLIERLQNLLDEETVDDAQSALQWKQKVADLSCGIYRLAQPCLANGIESTSESIKFSRIIIVEDNPDTMDALKNCLNSYVNHPDEIKLADIEPSVRAVRLLEGGKDLLFGMDPRKTLVCFDLELDSESRTPHIPDGLRLLYKTVNDYPSLPCIVVTGYRSQEHRSLGLRAGSFLLKPFTQEDVDYAITNAVRQGQVTWLYPREVQNRDAAVIQQFFTVEDIQQRMQEWVRKTLCDYLIYLKVDDSPMEKLYGADLAYLSNSDLFILDIAPLDIAPEGCEGVGDTLKKLLLSLRQFNPDAPVIIVWPFDRWKEIDRFLFGSLRRLFRDGVDGVLYKPTWLSDYEESTESLLSQVLRAFQLRPSFNVKFTVQLSIAPFIGRFNWNYVRGDSPEAKSDKSEERFAPFLIPLVRAFGLSAPLSALKNMSEYHQKRLAKAVQSEVMQNRNRWGGFKKSEDDNIDEERRNAIKGLAGFLLSNGPVQEPCSQEKETLRRLFNEFIGKLEASSEFQSYLTLEDWLRSRCFLGIEKHLEDVVRLFGGETRFELFARGSWLDERGTRVEDILVVVEFLANLSVVSREFVEQQIVQPLLDKYKEEAAILQEIPIRGFLW